MKFILLVWAMQSATAMTLIMRTTLPMLTIMGITALVGIAFSLSVKGIGHDRR